MPETTIYHNGKIATNAKPYFVDTIVVCDGKVASIGRAADLMGAGGHECEMVDLGGRTVILGLNDSHLHVIRGGLHYNLELRWDGVPSLADAMRMLKEQALRTPAPQWVRVVGGWTEFQFAERRMPTLEEINEVAPDTPVFVLHLYDRAMLNAAALRAVGYTKDTPDPIGGEIQRDRHGNPTGMLIARPNANALYSTLAKGPVLAHEDQLISTRHFMREIRSDSCQRRDSVRHQEFENLSPGPLPVSLDWAPTAHYGGYFRPNPGLAKLGHAACGSHTHGRGKAATGRVGQSLWGLGCDCFAF